MADPFAYSKRAAGGAQQQAGWQQSSPPHGNDGWAHFPDSPQPAAAGGYGAPAQAPSSGNYGGFPASTQYPPMPQQQPQQFGGMPAGGGGLYPQMPPASAGMAPVGGPGLYPPIPGGVPGGPDMFQSALSNPMAQIGVAYAQQAVQRGMTQYLPGAELLWRSLRYYFDVSNVYVLTKLQKVLFPFRSKRWHRVTVAESGHPNRHGGQEEAAVAYAPPIYDENAPDLYIPLMAAITYVLVHGLLRGTLQRAFHPEILVTTSSTALVTAILEVALLKAGMYALAVDAAPLLDLVSYAGYKYVGLVLNGLALLLAGPTAYTLVLLYTGLSAGYFIINTLMPVVRPDTYGRAAGGGAGLAGAPAQRTTATSQRNYLVVLIGLTQLLLMWWLGPSTAGAVLAGADKA